MAAPPALATLQQAQALLHAGQPAQALTHLEALCEAGCDMARAHHLRGDALLGLRRPKEALFSYEQALRLQPRYPEVLNNQGNALLQLHQPQAAVAQFDRAIALRPEVAEFHYNRGCALQAAQRLEEARSAYETTVGLKPQMEAAWGNLGNVLQALLRLDEALACYDRALELRPDHAITLCNKGHVLLLQGDYARGWPLHEWRWKKGVAHLRPRHFAQPLWLGEASPAGRTLLLHAEQGLGDTLQMCRYIPQVAALGARVLLEVPPSLIPLLSQLEGIAELIASGSGHPLPAFDLHCPLLSLPLALGTRPESVPQPGGYLRADPQRQALWQERLGPSRHARIGLAWSGNPGHQNDRHRSISLESWLPHLPPGPQYISLQKEVRPEDLGPLEGSSIRHFGAQLHDFTDTAALCACMDLVLSVDTSVAHLAGALGRPTWVLLPHVPDWRWLLDREDSPWYRSVRLFRQGADRQWPPVLHQVRQALEAFQRTA